MAALFTFGKPAKILDKVGDVAGPGLKKFDNNTKGIDNDKLSPSNYPNPDRPMSIPPVRYEPKTIEEVIRMRQGKGPTTKMTHGDKNIEAHPRQQVPVKNGGILDELEQRTHRGGGNHTRHDKPSQLNSFSKSQGNKSTP
ncbi:hypothetical protein [Gracilibacillus suaedae]|uniref:hypothetical protein n=1 Tax=Gracilibacillus suaedae TaxID=2820273 RepID=UPI001E349C05|nr:hypothetical protein [Gracilibacillus suaedae]